MDGKALASHLKEEVRQKVNSLRARNILPTLAVVVVGDDPASHIYVASKRRQCQEVGIESRQLTFPAGVCYNHVAEAINTLNQDPSVHGILVQLPLPAGLSEGAILDLLDPLKDVDGLCALNMGKLLLKQPGGMLPCTPQGILHLIQSTGVALAGKKAVVIGRSFLVGMPTAHLLLKADCTVTVAHSRTLNLKEICKDADILVAACGQPELVKGHWIKPGAIVIDVGIHRTPEGLVGDVARQEALGRAGYLSPVPGGVGPLTVAFLLLNTIACAIKQTDLVKI